MSSLLILKYTSFCYQPLRLSSIDCYQRNSSWPPFQPGREYHRFKVMIVQETQSEENAYFFNTEFNGILLEFDLFVKKTEEVPERTFDGDMLECMRDSLVWQKLCKYLHYISVLISSLSMLSLLIKSLSSTEFDRRLLTIIILFDYSDTCSAGTNLSPNVSKE